MKNNPTEIIENIIDKDILLTDYVLVFYKTEIVYEEYTEPIFKFNIENVISYKKFEDYKKYIFQSFKEEVFKLSDKMIVSNLIDIRNGFEGSLSIEFKRFKNRSFDNMIIYYKLLKLNNF